MAGLNESRGNDTASPDHSVPGTSTFVAEELRWFVVGFCAFVLAVEVLTVVVLYRTKTMAFAIKLLSIAVTVFDGGTIFIIMSSMVIANFSTHSPVLKEIWTELGRLTLAGSWITKAMISVERCYLFVWPDRYASFITRARITAISVVVWLVCLAGKLVTRYCVFPSLYEEEESLRRKRESGFILTIILGCCLALCVSCYGVIFKVLLRQRRQIYALNQMSKSYVMHAGNGSSNGIWVICLAFVLCYLPVFGTYLSRLDHEDGVTKKMVTAMTLLACCIDPVLYVWRFRECRYILVAMLAPLNKRMQSKAETMRMSVFSIVATDRKSFPSSQTL